MKESKAYQKKPDNPLEYFNYEDKLEVADIDKIMDIAGKESTIDHSEIRELTKIILKIDPIEVDDSLQAKFNIIMSKVRAQYA